MEKMYTNSIFWVEIERVEPNPYQPRREFDMAKLGELAESIRQYGVLQPLVVTRHEKEKEDGGITSTYELIAGERRLRASKLAGLSQVPVIIRSEEETDLMKLELAIIENIQREDLNAVDRARAFRQLASEFKFSHAEIAKKVGKSREYVSNTLRLLALPEDILEALIDGKITEGHTRPLLMLNDRKEEQAVLFKEILLSKLTVREAEAQSRHVAQDKARRKTRVYDPELQSLEKRLAERLGTRVQIIEQADPSGMLGGRLMIDFFSTDDLQSILHLIGQEEVAPEFTAEQRPRRKNSSEEDHIPATEEASVGSDELKKPVGDRSEDEKDEGEENLYSVKGFSI